MAGRRLDNPLATLWDGADVSIGDTEIRGRLDGKPFLVRTGNGFEAWVGLDQGRRVESLPFARTMRVPVHDLVAALDGRRGPAAGARRALQARLAQGTGSRDVGGDILPVSPKQALRHALGSLPAGVRDARPGALRRIAALPWPITDNDLLRALLWMPVEWIPSEEAEWRDLKATCEACASLSGPLGDHGFLAASRGRWGEFRRTLEGRLALPEAEDMAPWYGPQDATRRRYVRALSQRAEGVADMLSGFAQQVSGPALRLSGIPTGGLASPPSTYGLATVVAARVLLGGKGLAALLDAEAAWHARLPLIDAACDEAGLVGLRWAAPFPRFEAGGLACLPLTDSDALRKEGAPVHEGGLSHCVGAYEPACSGYRSVVVSVRAPSGERLSTAEFKYDGERLTLVQHRGPSNAAPGREASRAVAALSTALESGALSVSAEFRLKARLVRAGGVARPRAAIDAAAFAGVVRAWAPILPRPLREPEAVRAAVRDAALDAGRAWCTHLPSAYSGSVLPPAHFRACAGPPSAVDAAWRDRTSLPMAPTILLLSWAHALDVRRAAARRTGGRARLAWTGVLLVWIAAILASLLVPVACVVSAALWSLGYVGGWLPLALAATWAGGSAAAHAYLVRRRPGRGDVPAPKKRAGPSVRPAAP